MLTKIFNKKATLLKSVMGINERNLRLIYPNNDRKNYKYADDKLLTKKVLEDNGLACPQTYGAIGRIGDIEHIWSKMNKERNLVIKPSKGSGGDGIKLIRTNGVHWIKDGKRIKNEDIFSHIANIIFGMYSGGSEDRAIIEELILPHPVLTSFYEDGIPDIRIITHKTTPIMGMLRIPTNESDGKANLHQGGIGVGIDLKTGKLTYAYDGDDYITTHPDSGKEIPGKQLPAWDEVMDLTRKVSEVFPLDYLGIDIVMDKYKGPLVLEINIRPGLSIQMANKTGLKDVVKC